jgi:zinc protease
MKDKYLVARNRTVFSLFVLSFLLMCIGCNVTEEHVPTPQDSSSKVDLKKKYQEAVLTNGLTVLFEQDKEIPLVGGKLYIRGGALWDSDAQIGVTEVAGSLMRSGGAGKRSALELDRYLTSLSASVDSSWGDEYGSVSFGGLTADLQALFPVFADVVLHPRFEEDRLALWKSAAIDSIKRRGDDPGTIASILYDRLMYAKSAYGRTLVTRDVEKISREVLIKKHKELLNLSDALLVVSGSAEFDEIKRLAEKYFGNVVSSKRSEKTPPPIMAPPAPGIYFIKGPFTQATVYMGQLGIKRLPPDRAQIEVFNEIFGTRGFGSRLMTKIRTERGLVYGISGSISPGIVQGTNSVGLQTKSASVPEAIVESIRIIEEMQKIPPKIEEVASVQKALRNSFVFKFDSPSQRVDREAILRLLHYPEDYDRKYLPSLAGVVPGQVMEVAKKYWDPSKFIVTVVGDEKALDLLKEAVAKGPLSQYFKGVKELSFNEIPSGT